MDAAHLSEKQRRALILLIFAATMLRSMFALTGYGIDEAYTVATARTFHLSGYDHPPMAWWLAGAMQQLFDSTHPWVIRLPFVLLSGIATWQVFRLTELLFSPRAGLWAALAFCLAPALSLTDGAWVLPDGPLLVGLLGGAIALTHLFFSPQPRGWYWLVAGAWGGVAMLSKYHGVFFFLGAVLFVLRYRRVWLGTFWPYLGAALGLLIFSPVIVWNMLHDFASFAFQSGRTGDMQIHPFNPLIVLLGQAAFLTPWIWLGLVRSTLWPVVRGEKKAFLLFLGAPMVIIFTLVSSISSGQILFHWAMPGYLFFFPLLGVWLANYANRFPRRLRRMAIGSAAFIITAVVLMLLLWFAPTTLQRLGLPGDPLADMRPLSAIHPYLDAQGLDEQALVLSPTKWHRAGQFDVALAGRVPVTCFCRDARQYGILAPLSGFARRDVLIPIPLKQAGGASERLYPFFTQVERLDDLTILQGGASSQTYAMFLGKNLRPEAAPE